MKTFILSLILLTFACVSLFTLVSHSSLLQGLHEKGARFLAAALSLISSIGVSLWILSGVFGAHLYFGPLFGTFVPTRLLSVSEMVLFLLFVPLLFSQFSAFTAAGMLAYLLGKNIGVTSVNREFQLLAFLLTANLVLADFLPWVKSWTIEMRHRRFRQSMALVLAFLSLSQVLIALVRFRDFSSWLIYFLNDPVNTGVIFVLCIGLALGWILVAFGVQQTFLLPALTLGTVVVYGFLNLFPEALVTVLVFLGIVLTIALPSTYPKALLGAKR